MSSSNRGSKIGRLAYISRHPFVGMPRLLSTLLVAAFVPAVVVPAGARTLVVDGAGGAQYSKVQDAIDAAAPGDTVLVRPGRYLETVIIVAVDVHLIGSGGPEATIIDGNGSGPVIHCVGISSNSSIQGFTITGGVTVPPLVGGGIYLAAQASPLIEGNVIAGNRVEGAAGPAAPTDRRPSPGMPALCEPVLGSGGGIYVYFECLPLITENVIEDNVASGVGGGVVFWDHADARLEGNNIHRNTAGRAGGGVYVGCNAMPTLENNIIAWNEAPSGGAVFLDGFEADAAVTRNTLYRNLSADGGGIRCKGPCRPRIDANLIALNSGGGVLCDAETEATLSCNVIWWGGGETFGDECFPFGALPDDTYNRTAVVGLCDPEAGDFRLCSQPLLRECGEVGAPAGLCPPGSCVAKVSWGMIKALYR